MRHDWQVIIFTPLVPFLFPIGLTILAGCYHVNPSTSEDLLMKVVSYGPYIIVCTLGIATRRRVLLIFFCALLLLNLAGCIMGMGESDAQKKQSFQPTAAASPVVGR